MNKTNARTAPSVSMSRYIAMQILTAVIDAPDELVVGEITAAHGRAQDWRLLSALGEHDYADDSWLFWQQPGQALTLTVEDLADLPKASLYLVVSLNTKGVLEMQAWQVVDNAPVTIPIEVSG